MDKLPFLAVIQQHLAVVVGGFVALVAFPFVLRWLKGWIMGQVGHVIVSLLEAGDDHVDRLIAHAVAVLSEEIPDNLSDNKRAEQMVIKFLAKFPALKRHELRLVEVFKVALAAIDERAKAGVQGFSVVLLDADGRTIIEKKK